MQEVNQLVKFSPSSADRWGECPVAAIVAAMPREYKSSIYTATGTAVMRHIETAIENFEEDGYFDALVGTAEKVEGHEIRYEESDTEAAKVFFREVSVLEANGGKIETELDLSSAFHTSEGVAKMRGRLDLLATFEDRYEIVDYKHGQGVSVNARNNKQLLSYAFLVNDCRGPKDFYRLRIIQPRSPAGEKDSIWEFSQSDLDSFRPSLDAAFVRAFDAAKYLNKNGEIRLGGYSPGGHCKWCPIEVSCPARVNRAISVACCAKRKLEDGGFLKNLLDNADMIKSTISNAEKFADDELLSGRKIFGYKLIESFGNRSVKKVFTPEQIEELKSAKLIQVVDKYPNIADLEKAEKKGLIKSSKDYIDDGKRKPKVVPWDCEGAPWNTLDEFETGQVAKTEE